MPRVKITAEGQDTSSLNVEIAHLRGLDVRALRFRWRIAFGREAPSELARHLLFAMLAYRLQAEVLGDLDADTVRFLNSIELAASKKAAVPLTLAFEQRKREIAAGTVLTREWAGQHHRVMVLDGGFVWEGLTYRSLSEIARAITGTQWGGPRFFGLREKQQAETPS
jgi:Protein of unknown function (DUF2924)